MCNIVQDESCVITRRQQGATCWCGPQESCCHFVFEDHLSGGSRSSEEVIVTDEGYVAGGGEAEATWMKMGWGGAARRTF